MPSHKINFTKAALSNISIPEKGKRDYYHDQKEKGLILDVTGAGSKSFYLYQRVEGRPERVFLGKFPDLSIENARKLAIQKKGEIALGKNPQNERRKFRQEMTLGDLYQEYMERYSKRQKRSWQYDEREIPKYLGHWFNRKLSQIKKSEIQLYHTKVHDKNGLYQANRVLERTRAMYNKAIEWGWEGTNPTIGIKKFKEKSRDRFIQPNELPCLMRALQSEENEVARDFIIMALYTGARKTNVLQMRWEQIDFTRNIWRIPETKNGEPQDVILIPQAIEVLKNRKLHGAISPWVFPSDSKAGHLADPKKAWIRAKQLATIYIWEAEPHLKALIDSVKESMPEQIDVGRIYKGITKKAEEKGVYLEEGLMDIRLHDIRRTFGSYQAISGASLQVIGKSLGHKSQHATQVYSRLHNDPVREAMEKAGQMMEDLGNEHA